MKRKLCAIGMAGLFTATALAGSMGDVDSDIDNTGSGDWGKVITLSLGPAWYNDRGESLINFVPSVLNPPGFYHNYVPTVSTGIMGSGEVFFGLTSALTKRMAGQLGIAVGYSGNGKHNGRFYIGPVSDIGGATSVSTYSYLLSNARIGFKGKLVADWAWWVKPYVSAFTGVGFNRSWDYETSHNSFGLASQPEFQQYTTVAFSYTAGVGIQGNIGSCWQLGIGYEFADWGKSRLGAPSFPFTDLVPANVVVVYDGLHAGTFYTQSAQISLSYIS